MWIVDFFEAVEVLLLKFFQKHRLFLNICTLTKDAFEAEMCFLSIEIGDEQFDDDRRSCVSNFLYHINLTYSSIFFCILTTDFNLELSRCYFTIFSPFASSERRISGNIYKSFFPLIPVYSSNSLKEERWTVLFLM